LCPCGSGNEGTSNQNGDTDEEEDALVCDGPAASASLMRSPNVGRGVLILKLYEAQYLANRGALGGESRPQVFIQLGPKFFKSTVKTGTSPQWNEIFEFYNVLPRTSQNLSVEVVHHANYPFGVKRTLRGVSKVPLMGFLTPTYPSLGTLKIPIRDVVDSGYLIDTWTLSNSNNATIRFSLTWREPIDFEGETHDES